MTLDLKTALGPAIMDLNRWQHEDRIRFVLGHDVPSFALLADQYLGSHFTIVGSGPSAKHTIKRIPKGSIIIAINAAHDWLIAEGIVPHFAFMLDPRGWLEKYQTIRKDVTYLYGTTCHPFAWQKAFDADVKPYAFIPNIEEDTHAEFAHYTAQFGDKHTMCFLPGPSTAGLRAFYAASSMGAAMVDGHGFDSCYPPGIAGTEEMAPMHAHYKPTVTHDAREVTVESKADGSLFTCRTNGSMARQIPGFYSLVSSLGRLGTNADLNVDVGGGYFREAKMCIRMWGDGAIPWMAWKDGSRERMFWHAESETMEGKYGRSRHWDFYTDSERDAAIGASASGIEWGESGPTRAVGTA